MMLRLIQLLAQAYDNHYKLNKSYGYIPHILAVLSSIIWPISWIYTNEHNINIGQSTIVRGVTTLIFNYCMCLYTNSSTSFVLSHKWPALLTRSLILVLTSLFVAASQYILPLPIVHTILASSTLHVFIINYLLYQNQLNIKQCVGIIIGLTGIIMVSFAKFVYLWIDSQYQQNSEYSNYIDINVYQVGLFTIAFMIVMMLWSYAYVITKKLQYNVFQINYFLGYAYLLIGCCIYQFIPQRPQKIHQHQFYKSIAYTGLPLIVDQLFLISALKMSKQIGPILMISFNTVIVAYIVGYVRYGEIPSIMVNVGIILLAIGLYQILFNIRQENEGEQQRQIESQSGEDNEDGTFRKGIHKSMRPAFDSESIRKQKFATSTISKQTSQKSFIYDSLKHQKDNESVQMQNKQQIKQVIEKAKVKQQQGDYNKNDLNISQQQKNIKQSNQKKQDNSKQSKYIFREHIVSQQLLSDD